MSDDAHVKRHLFRGQWLTRAEIAAASGKSLRTIHRRFQFGMSLEADPLHGRKPKQYEFRGTLATIKEIAAATGLSRQSVSERLDGQRFFEEPELPDMVKVPRHDARLIFFNGISDNVNGWSQRVGLNPSTLAERLRAGWTIKNALMKPSRSRQYRRCTYRDITDTLSGWSRRTGIRLATLKERVVNKGWPIEVALTAQPMEPASRVRRRKMLTRMIEGFHASSADADLPDAPDAPADAIPADAISAHTLPQASPGGPSKTFAPLPTTGAHL